MNVGWLDGLSDCLCWKISCHNVHRSSLAHLCGWYPYDWPTSQCLYSFSHIQGSPYLLEPGKFGCVSDKPCNCQISYCTMNIWLQYPCHAHQNYALLKCQIIAAEVASIYWTNSPMLLQMLLFEMNGPVFFTGKIFVT